MRSVCGACGQLIDVDPFGLTEIPANWLIEFRYCEGCTRWVGKTITFATFDEIWNGADKFPGYQNFCALREILLRAITRDNDITMKIEPHQLAEIFPPMSPDERTELMESIKDHGLKEKIVMLDGKILDGLNRYDVCLEAKIPPLFREFDPTIDGDPVDFVKDKNLNRRHLSTSQRATIAADLLPFYAAKVAAQKAAAAKDKADKKAAKDADKARASEAGLEPKPETITEKMARIHNENGSFVEGAVAAAEGKGLEDNPHKTAHPKHDFWRDGWQQETARQIALDESEDVPKEKTDDDDIPIGTKATTAAGLAAAATGVSERSVHTAADLKETAPEQYKQVKAGEKSLHQASQDAKAMGESISPYRAECADMLEAGLGEEIAQSIRACTILKTTGELESFMKQTSSVQKEILGFVVKGWKVADAVQFLKGEFTAGTTVTELMNYCNVKGGDVAVEIAGFTITITNSAKK